MPGCCALLMQTAPWGPRGHRGHCSRVGPRGVVSAGSALESLPGGALTKNLQVFMIPCHTNFY